MKAVFFIAGILIIILVITVSISMQTTSQPTTYFNYLDEHIAQEEFFEFTQRRTTIENELAPLQQLLEIHLAQQDVSIYYEDLNSHAQLSLNKEKKFIPGSLLKVLTLITIMKKVEYGNLLLDQEVLILPEDIDKRYGLLHEQGSGYTLSLLELMQFSTKSSDNTAEQALRRQINQNEHIEAMLASGIPYITEAKDNLILVRAQDMGKVFHSLYHHTYIQEESNHLILSLLTQTEFKQGLEGGVPSHVKVAHKIGSWAEGMYNHDCGIVYHETHPYTLCIMTENTHPQEAEHMIKEISRVVYEFVEKRK